MKSKDKQIRELRENQNAWIILCAMFFVLFMVSTILGLAIAKENRNTEQQLESCQEKVPEIECWYNLSEEGTYDFSDNGILTSPSGKEIKCRVIE